VFLKHLTVLSELPSLVEFGGIEKRENSFGQDGGVFEVENGFGGS
jgi:hypothetical protein